MLHGSHTSQQNVTHRDVDSRDRNRTELMQKCSADNGCTTMILHDNIYEATNSNVQCEKLAHSASPRA
jgi:hypothetical protein